MRPFKLSSLALFVGLVALVVVGRLAPHPPNLTPVVAAALFAGFFFQQRGAALAVPLAAMMIADVFLGAYSYGVMVTVYAALLAPVVAGPWLQRKLSVWRVGAAAVGFSLLFFLTTNFAEWLFVQAYPMTFDGLVTCYAAAVPFFRYMLTGDLAYSALLFGSYAACRWLRSAAELRATRWERIR